MLKRRFKFFLWKALLSPERTSPKIPSEDFWVQTTFSLLALSLFTHPKREELTIQIIVIQFMLNSCGGKRI